MAAAARRPDYFPIAFLYPLAGMEQALGFDPASEPLRKETMDYARDSGQLSATKTLQLVTPFGSHKSFMFFAPYYRTGGATATIEQRRQNIVGYPSNAPFGYINFTDNLRKIIIPHPINGSLVTQIYGWYASGQYSLSSIFDHLAKNFSSVFENRRKLAKSSIQKILTNPIYYGDFIWNGEYYRGTHEPLVSRELFEAVQEMLRRNGHRRMPQKRHKFTFQGLVRCGHCGCAMVAELKKGKYIYYHCTQKKGKCPGRKSVLDAELDRQFAASLQLIQMPEEAVSFVVKALKESHYDKKEYRDRVVSQLRSDLKNLRSRLDAMYLDKLDGKIAVDYYDKKQREWHRGDGENQF